MPIVGHGVDIVRIARIEKLMERHAERFAERCFTAAELEYATAHPARTAEIMAGRFAAKEAAAKALGTGMTGGVSFRDIETVRNVDGRPMLRLHGPAGEVARTKGIESMHVSISHTRNNAMASVILEG